MGFIYGSKCAKAREKLVFIGTYSVTTALVSASLTFENALQLALPTSCVSAAGGGSKIWFPNKSLSLSLSGYSPSRGGECGGGGIHDGARGKYRHGRGGGTSTSSRRTGKHAQEPLRRGKGKKSQKSFHRHGKLSPDVSSREVRHKGNHTQQFLL